MRLRVHGLAAALVAAVCGGCIALSGLTLTLVPAVATSRGTATVKVPRGETVLAARTWQDRSQLWFQMFLVFAMPAAAPRKVARRRGAEARASGAGAGVGRVRHEPCRVASPTSPSSDRRRNDRT
ncbi:MAG: hypothetical protein JNK56_34705 [Myxococcales bacterium]|nr:hypothetical protein [Myxococcales bacterium]